MRILHVSIKNFRCFKSLEVDLEPCHAFIGENGSGKTAVLDAIDLATSPSMGASRIDEQDFNSADAGPIEIEVSFSDIFWLKVPDGYTTQAVPSRSVVLSVKRRERAAPGRALSDPFVVEHYARPLAFSNQGELGAIPTGLNCPTSLSQTSEGFSVARKSGSAMKLSTLQLTLRNELVGFPNVFCFDKDRERQAKVGFNSLLQKIARDLNWRYRSKWEKTELLRAWDDFYGRVIGTVEDAKSGRILRPLQDQAKELLGQDFSDLELGLLELEQPFAKAFLARRSDSNQIENARLGSGVAIVVAYLLLDVISSLSKETIIYLIDEPELHLHPQLQHRLFQRFKKASHQTVFTTQSDCFVDVSSWRGITRFLPTHETTPRKESLSEVLENHQLPEHLDEIKKWHQHEAIFFREDNQIFFARKCLLVEGPSEKYGLPVLAATVGIDLGDLTVISCNGKSKIPYYQLLAKAFEVPFYTIFDRDGRSESDGDNRRSSEWAADSAKWTFENTFEKLLGVSDIADHKGSTVLVKIDSMNKGDVPPDIKACLEAVGRWSVGAAVGSGELNKKPRGARKESAREVSRDQTDTIV